MNTKAIVMTDVNKAELVDQTIGTPGPNGVLVKMAYTAVSAGTERANLIGEKNVSGDKTAVPKFPRTSGGYSGTGTVVEVGSNISDLKPGDTVFGFWGRHSQYLIFDRSKLAKIDPAKVSMLEAAFTNIACFSLAGVRKVKIEIGESAMVMGLGLLGLYAIQLCKLNGAFPVIAADPNPARRELALKLGADFALDPTVPDFTAQVKALTGKGVNAVVEVSGVGDAFNQALDAMARFGRISLLGCTRHSVTVDFYHDVHFKGITIVGAHTLARPSTESYPGMWTDADDVAVLLKLLAAKKINFASMISEVHSPIDAPEVYTRLAFDKSFPIGVAFDWSKL